MESKTFNADLELRPTEGKFRALICTFDTPDKGGDIVRASAFDASLKRKRARNERIPVVYDHEISDPMNVIGEVSPHDTQATSKGLIVSGELFMAESRAAKVHALLKRGTLREWSFGCHVQSARPRPGGEGREFLVLDLFEVSVTALGKGTTETLMVASATAPGDTLTTEEQLAPYRAELEVLRQRVARQRRAS